MILRFATFLLIIAALPAQAALSPNDIAQAGAHPAADAHIPLRTRWTDQNGVRIRLGDLVRGRPTVLLFVDYTCRHICGPGLTLTAGALHDSGLKVGRDVSLIVLGFNPRDGPVEAKAMADRQLASLPDVAANVELLSADPATIAEAKRALGFTAVWDPAVGQYAHDASAYVFNAKGRLNRLLPETALVAPILMRALSSPQPIAAKPQKPSFLVHVATVCYGFAAAHGLYGPAIVSGLRWGGIILLALGGILLLLGIKRGRRNAS